MSNRKMINAKLENVEDLKVLLKDMDALGFEPSTIGLMIILKPKKP